MKTFAELKARHRAEREHYATNLSLRVHRALSWMSKAEQCDDDDSRFTFLWIAFNAAYAQEYDQRQPYGERSRYEDFLKKLIELDGEEMLFRIVWDNYAGTIRGILNNEFILQAYWDYHAGRIQEQEWLDAKAKAKSVSNKALGQNNTLLVLAVLFTRLYTLRNQIIHGGATYSSSANRKQLRDCTNILEKIVPVVIELMMNGQGQLWGDPVYPVINS
jgi:hypothetical protein